MIMPNKIVKPEHSLIVIGAYVIKNLLSGKLHVDILIEKTLKDCPYKIKADNVIMALNYLFIVNKINVDKDSNASLAK